MLIIPVKAANFGPHGNFGLFLASSVASVDESCTKKTEQNQICRSKVFLQLLFSSFFCRTRFNDSKPFWNRGPKFPWGPKLGAFTVTLIVLDSSSSFDSLLGKMKTTVTSRLSQPRPSRARGEPRQRRRTPSRKLRRRLRSRRREKNR